MLFIQILFFLKFSVSFAELNLELLAPSENYIHSLYADDNNPQLYQLYWKLIDKETIQFEIICQTNGWVGFGLSPNGDMTGSDIAIGWVTKDGKSILKDTYANSRSTPKIDPKQDWILLEAREIKNYTTLKIKRKLNTCDKENDLEIKEETQRLIFAWNDFDPVTGENDWLYHGQNRKIKSAILLNVKPDNSIQIDDEITRIIEFNISDALIPIKDTYYLCSIFPVVALEEDLHLISFEVLIDKLSTNYAHHFDLYICEFSDTRNLSSNFSGYQFECGPGGKPDGDLFEKTFCSIQTMIFGWAIGGGKIITLPKNVGFKLEKSNQRKLFMIQAHYDNSNLNSNVRVNTGLRLKLTKNLREHDMGFLTLQSGAKPLDIQIPPQTDKLKLTSICYPECTQKFFPENGITVFAGNFHTHLQGIALRTLLIRNGKIDRYLFDDPNYNFNYQSNMNIEPLVLKKRGYGTNEEMCMNFLYYYPRVNFDSCESYFKPTDLFKFYQDLMKDSLIPKIDLIESSDDVNYKILNHLKYNVQPSKELSERYKNFYENATNQLIYCGAYNSQSEAIENIEKPFYKINEYLKEEDSCSPINNNNLLSKIISFFYTIFNFLINLFNW